MDYFKELSKADAFTQYRDIMYLLERELTDEFAETKLNINIIDEPTNEIGCANTFSNTITLNFPLDKKEAKNSALPVPEHQSLKDIYNIFMNFGHERKHIEDLVLDEVPSCYRRRYASERFLMLASYDFYVASYPNCVSEHNAFLSGQIFLYNKLLEVKSPSKASEDVMRLLRDSNKKHIGNLDNRTDVFPWHIPDFADRFALTDFEKFVDFSEKATKKIALSPFNYRGFYVFQKMEKEQPNMFNLFGYNSEMIEYLSDISKYTASLSPEKRLKFSLEQQRGICCLAAGRAQYFTDEGKRMYNEMRRKYSDVIGPENFDVESFKETAHKYCELKRNFAELKKNKILQMKASGEDVSAIAKTPDGFILTSPNNPFISEILNKYDVSAELKEIRNYRNPEIEKIKELHQEKERKEIETEKKPEIKRDRGSGRF